jgi:uncharacterized protein
VTPAINANTCELQQDEKYIKLVSMKSIKVLITICFLLNAVFSNGQHQVFDNNKLLLQPFNYNEVKLQQSPLKKQFDEVVEDYLAIPNDDILKGFRERAGLPTNGAKDMGGWYSNDVFHVFGQFIAGMSRLYAASGNEALKTKVNTLVAEWAKTIDKDGYFFYSKKPNAPHYVYEKMTGGLVDNYVFTGNKNALKYLSVITDWAIKNLNRDRIYGQTKSEWYTLSENLYRAYAVTKDKKYLDFGKLWEYTDYWNVYARGEKVNAEIHHHAYSHVNTLSSAAAAYMVSSDEKYKTIIKNAYDYLQNEQCFATGGFGPNERFLFKDDLINTLENTHNTFETQCGSWAIFKLSKYLMEVTGDAKYGDWIEKMTINGIGANVPMTKDGRVFYYSDYNPRQGTKNNYHQGWSCCTGTRPQAVAEYADLVYFKSSKGLFVNLYTPSKVQWNGVTVEQQTKFPESNVTQFVVNVNNTPTDDKVIGFRKPAWAREMPVITVNGKTVKPSFESNWMQVERKWKNGDRVKLVFPMNLYVARLDVTKAFPSAIMYGPVAMAANVIADYPTDFVDEKNLLSHFVAASNQPLNYKVKGHENLTLKPFYQYAVEEPYVLYFDPAVKNVIPKKYWQLTGNWQRAKGPYFTNDANGSLTTNFTGKGIIVFLSAFQNSGIAKVVIDGKEMGKVNTFTPLNKEVQLTKTYDGLAEGKHTVTVAVTGEKDSLSKNTFINVLKLEVIE